MKLSNLGTFQLGGPCEDFVDCPDEAQLVAAVRDCQSSDKRFVLIGGGSNLLFSDEGYDGTVIRYWNPEAVPVLETSARIEVPASAVLDDVARWTAEAGLDGLMCTTGIPGAVGGAVVGNAGAWGKQVGDVLAWVRVLTPAGEVQQLVAAELDFTYRNSKLKRSGDIVLAAAFDLVPADRAALLAERERILKIRWEKHPDLAVDPCIGSIFQNLEPTSAAGRRQAAGFFLEQAGAKSLRIGGARVYEKHANIIVAGEGAKAQDVFDLCAEMTARVREVFEFELRREVRFLGRFAGAEAHGGFF